MYVTALLSSVQDQNPPPPPHASVQNGNLDLNVDIMSVIGNRTETSLTMIDRSSVCSPIFGPVLD